MLRAAIPLALVLALAGCGDDTDTGDPEDVSAFTLRVQLLTADNAVTVWGRAENLAVAHAAAEGAANLVVGSGGPGYGDRNGDGTVEAEAESEFGILPGLDGTPPALAALVENECVEDDVLGGSWDDPAARWAELETAVDAWSAENNTIPDLASNPMRIVAWAMLALSTDSLDEAREFGNRAKTNVSLSLGAIDC
jgi:hypothetical protein